MPPTEITPITIDTDRGPVGALYHAVPGATTAVVAVGGTIGGFEGPANALYPDLAALLQERGIATLRLDFRIHQAPNIVPEAVSDVRAGIAFLEREGMRRIGLVGHSFGGAVVIDAGVEEPAVVTVVTLATQTAGAQRVDELSPRPILLVHGLDDTHLSPEASRILHEWAREPKRLVLLPGATHSLRQVGDEVRRLLLEWFMETLPEPAAPA